MIQKRPIFFFASFIEWECFLQTTHYRSEVAFISVIHSKHRIGYKAQTDALNKSIKTCFSNQFAIRTRSLLFEMNKSKRRFAKCAS